MTKLFEAIEADPAARLVEEALQELHQQSLLIYINFKEGKLSEPTAAEQTARIKTRAEWIKSSPYYPSWLEAYKKTITPAEKEKSAIP